jgi:hypothetical protein
MEFPDSVAYVVQGGTPGADSNTYTLFDSTTAFQGTPSFSAGKGMIPTKEIARFIFNLNNSQTGTLKAFWSNDGGTTWNQYYSASVAAAVSPVMNGPIDFPVDGYRDWRLQWTNGGSAQGTWIAALSSTRNRSLAQ